MPIQLDFSRSNQTLARFNQFLSYDLLDQMRSDRDAGLMQVQDKLMREREVERGQIDIGVARYKSALTDKEAYTKAMLDFAKLPGADYLVSMARLATDPNLPQNYHTIAAGAAKEYAAIILPAAQAAQAASEGKGTWEDYDALIKAGGFKGMEEGYKESGTNRRANLAAEVDREKMGVEREKLGAAERGVSVKATDEKAKQYVDWIDKTVAFISGEGVKGNALVDAVLFLTGGKTRDPYAPEVYGKVLSDLQGLKRKILNNEPLTRGNEDYIIKVWNARSLDASQAAGGAAGATGRPAETTQAPAAAGGGGVPNVETGLTGQDEAGITAQKRQALVNHYTELYIQQVYGGARSPENIAQATADANEFISKFIMK